MWHESDMDSEMFGKTLCATSKYLQRSLRVFFNAEFIK